MDYSTGLPSMTDISNPTAIAREVLRRLATNRAAPTPDNYHRLYHEIAGTTADAGSDAAQNGEQNLSATQTAALTPAATPPWGSLIKELLKQLEARHSGLTPSKKKEALERVLSRFAADPAELHAKLQNLLKSWSDPTASAKQSDMPLVDDIAVAPATQSTQSASGVAASPVPAGVANDVPAQLQKLLVQLLESALIPQLDHAPALAAEARALAQQIRAIDNRWELTRLSVDLKQLSFKLKLHGEDGVKIQQGLLRLLNLLLKNISELLEDDQWLHGQIAVLQEIIANPLDLQVIAQAERGLKEVIFKQGVLKHSINEAKASVKDMVARFIDRVGDLSETTGEYHSKLEHYSQKIGQTEDIGELLQLITEVMRETRSVQTNALRSRDDLLLARKAVETAQEKIKQLEAELEQLSEKVQEDQLTGTLNRRGLEDAFEREAARADRQGSLLCLAILDIDDFKQINDTHGHQTGDDALKYLARMVDETIRPTDIVARFGGEEFVILLPETGMDEAVEVMTRLQRNLTKKFFLHNNERLLMTFSAGVAQRIPGETQDAVVARADKALYIAKQTGKNRVLAAE
ncbi:MAG: diguanylate cyclase [Nitrosospira sp.]|nr:diguanylate cyclase [Nitrosospira sp.]